MAHVKINTIRFFFEEIVVLESYQNEIKCGLDKNCEDNWLTQKKTCIHFTSLKHVNL